MRENTTNLLQKSRLTYAEAANLAVNQTLVRSINTSIVALLPVGAILYVGAVQLGSGSLKDLALALFVGMAVGAYSSIFIATPLLVQLKSSETEVNFDRAPRQGARREAAADRYAAVPSSPRTCRSRRRPRPPDPRRGRRRGRHGRPPTGDGPAATAPRRSARGRVVPTAHGPVERRAAPPAGVQPTRQPRSKRGKK